MARIPGTALEVPLRRYQRPAEAPAVARPPARQAGPPSGASGVDSANPFADLTMGGIDLTPELTGHRKFAVYEEMRKTDPAVRSTLWMFKLPIRGADWSLDVGGQDGIDAVIHEATAQQFGLEDTEGWLDQTWDEWGQQSMLFFDFGSMFEEPIWGDAMIWRPPGAGTDSRIIRPLQRFAPRFPATIDRIETDPQSGLIKRLRQPVLGADWISGDNLAWYVPEREGSDWYGTSLLRAMYGPWRLKKALMVASALAWDRYASGVPVVRYPRGGAGREKVEAQQIARNYRTHERAWITFEGTKEQGWDIDIVGGSGSIADPVPLIRLYDEQIASGGLQQFSKLGQTPTGARAVGEILVDPFYQAVVAYAEFLRASRQRLAIRRFVDVNFGPEYVAPKLRVGKIQSKNVLVMAQAIEYLSSAGLTFTDRDTQDDLRDMLDLRHLPEVEAAVGGLPGDVGVASAVPEEGGGLNA